MILVVLRWLLLFGVPVCRATHSAQLRGAPCQLDAGCTRMSPRGWGTFQCPQPGHPWSRTSRGRQPGIMTSTFGGKEGKGHFSTCNVPT